MAKKVTIDNFGQGIYRIGGLLFTDGVATVDELSPSDKDVIEMLGAKVEDADGGDDESKPEPEQPAEDGETPEVPSSAAPDAPAPNDQPAGTSFALPPSTPEQADAQEHEVVTTSSDTDGHATLDAGEHVES